MTQQINPTLLDSATLAMLRDTNRLINGDMRIDQRNNGAPVAVTSSSPYTVDRWTAGMTGANGTSGAPIIHTTAGLTASQRVYVNTAGTWVWIA